MAEICENAEQYYNYNNSFESNREVDITETIAKSVVDSAAMLDVKVIVVRGKETEEQINILGDDSVPIDYHVTLWKSEFVDFVILQQDAFDKIDATTSLERQEFMLKKVIGVTRSEFRFENFEEVAIYFKRGVEPSHRSTRS